MKNYKGACHCGTVKYEIQADINSAFDCNCSMCAKKGTILAMVPESSFTLLSGADSLSNYHFYKNVIDHTFCKNCGVTPFLTGKDPKGNVMKAINVRCLENFDVKSIQLNHVDGKSF